MKEKLHNDQYESPQLKVFTIENEGVLCGSVNNGGIEDGIPDEI